jgi:hypothetical protein
MKLRTLIAIASIAFGITTFSHAQQASLENPQPGSFQSGIGLISGWSCAGNVQVLIDGNPLAVAYGTGRGDVASTCGGNGNVGFGLLINYNTLGNGIHTAQLRVGGANVGGPVQFTVTAPAGEFPLGLSGQVTISGFPSANKSTTLRWQQSQQNFAIVSVTDIAAPGTTLPLTFRGLRLNSITTAAGSPAGCNATLSFTNTTGESLTGLIYFDVLQAGVVRDQIIFGIDNVAGGASGSDATTVFISQNPVDCGTFTLQFNATDSAVAHL